MDFEFPKKLNYHLEEGEYTMSFAPVTRGPQIKTGNCTCQRKVRLSFVDDSNPRSLVQDAAGRNFCLECHQDELATFLQDMLGDRLADFLDDRGRINFDALVGIKVFLTIRHIAGIGGRHSHPYCKIETIRPVEEPSEGPISNPFSIN